MDLIAYHRISKNPDGTIVPLDKQEESTRLVAKLGGHRIIASYSDTLSGWAEDVKRPGWEAFLRHLDSGEVEGLIIYHADRLHRNGRDSERLLRVVKRRKLAMVTPQQVMNLGADTDAQMVYRMMSAVSINQSDATSRRIRLDKQYGRDHGDLRRVLGGRARFGWRNAPEGWVVDEDAAKALRAAAERLLAGEDLLTIHADLAPLIDSYGTPVDYKRLRSTLTMPVTAGLMLDADGKVMEQVITVDEPPLDRVTFERLAALFGSRKRGRATTGRYPLGPLLRCGKCGNQLTGQTPHAGRGGKVGQPNYACANPHPGLGVTEPCRGIFIGAKAVHDLIEEGLAMWAESPTGKAASRLQLDLGPAFAELETRRSLLQTRMAGIEAKRGRYLSDADADELSAGLIRELDAVADERAALVEADANPVPHGGQGFAEMTPAQQRKLVADVFVTPVKVNAAAQSFPAPKAADRVDLRLRPRTGARRRAA